MSQRITPGSNGGLVSVFLVNESTGLPETGVTSITAEYRRAGASGFTLISSPFVTETAGGEYQLFLPSAAVASGASYVAVRVSGTGWTQAGGPEIVVLDVAVSSRLAPTTAGRTLDVDADGEVVASNMRGTDNALLASSYTAPNNAGISTAASEAAGANTKAGAIQTVLSGITSLANWIRVLARSDGADATALSEIGGTYDDTTDSLEAIRDRGDAEWTGDASGDGPVAFTATVQRDDNSDPIQDADVVMVEVGGSARRASGKTTGTGLGGGTVDLGLYQVTYSVTVAKDGFNSLVTTHTVTSDPSTHAKTFSLVEKVVSAPNTPSGVVGSGTVIGRDNQTVAGAVFIVRMVSPPGDGVGGNLFVGPFELISDANGFVSLEHTQGATYSIEHYQDNQLRGRQQYTAPSNNTPFALPYTVGNQGL